jgi:hypothetical protein
MNTGKGHSLLKGSRRKGCHRAFLRLVGYSYRVAANLAILNIGLSTLAKIKHHRNALPTVGTFEKVFF